MTNQEKVAVGNLNAYIISFKVVDLVRKAEGEQIGEIFKLAHEEVERLLITMPTERKNKSECHPFYGY